MKSISFDKLASVGFQEAIDNALANIDTDIDSAVSIFTNALLESASCMNKKITYNSKGNSKAKWFDEECFQLKREVKRTLRQYRRKSKLCDLQSYMKMCKGYKSKLGTKKRRFIQRQFDSLFGSAGNPKDFWEEIRKVQK